jgi:peptidoglycan/LPS O-acetylase OafA/YrhL
MIHAAPDRNHDSSTLPSSRASRPAGSPAYRPFGALRFALAMMVLLQHGLLLLPVWQRGMLYELELGAVAVAVFFALSGFIVAEAATSFYAGRPAAFLVNRTLRVVPPYLAALAVTVAVDGWLANSGRLVPLDGPLRGSPWQFRVILAAVLEIVPGLPASRISGQTFSFIPFAWTLRVEFAFYVVACLTCWLMLKGATPVWTRRVGAAAFAAAYAAFAVFLLRLGLHDGGARQILNVPFFAFGVAAFIAFRTPSRGAMTHLCAAAACVPVAFVVCGERGDPVLIYQLPILVVLYGMLLVLARAPSPPGAWRVWDRRLGELSYPLYIGHGVVLTLLASLSARRGLLPYSLAIPGALAVAIVLHLAVEQPLRRLRTRIRGAAV